MRGAVALFLGVCGVVTSALGCAATLDYAQASASRRAGQGVGNVVGDKAVKEVKGLVDPDPSRSSGGSASSRGSGSSAGAGRTVTASAGGGPAFAGGDAACSVDPHCLAADDVLVCDSRSCTPSHALTPPSAASKQQGRFIAKTNGRESWSDGWIRSRAIQDGERLQVGQHVVYVRGESPQSHQEALNAHWYVGIITDISDGFKGEFRSSHGHAVRLASARLVIEAGSPELQKEIASRSR